MKLELRICLLTYQGSVVHKKKIASPKHLAVNIQFWEQRNSSSKGMLSSLPPPAMGNHPPNILP